MKKIILIISILLLLTSCSEKTYFSEETDEKEIVSDIRVDIKGAVKFPGVYIVPSTFLVKDIINVAGGLLDNADYNSINMVMPLFDNQMLNIPYISNLNSPQTLININVATATELTSLPGIGISKANNIIEYRNKNGVFRQIEDIKNVSGIGEDVFNKIKAYITV